MTFRRRNNKKYRVRMHLSFLTTSGKAKKVFSNSGVVVEDLGDGILNVEFRSKMNTIGGDVLDGLNKAIDMAERDYQGLVVANNGSKLLCWSQYWNDLYDGCAEQEYDELKYGCKVLPGHNDANEILFHTYRGSTARNDPWWWL
jgi:hypothetical protein